jgi:predicted Fe-Mo cluster-binding NifX family protein
MKIAVATEDGKKISAHFGRSPYFAIFEIEGGKTANRSMRPNTFTGHFRGGHGEGEHGHGEHGHGAGEGHQHGSGDGRGHGAVAEGLGDCGVVISHGMGRAAWEDLRARGIEMIVTDERDVDTAVQKYLAGDLKDHVEKLHG